MKRKDLPKCECGSQVNLFMYDGKWTCPICIGIEIRRLEFDVDYLQRENKKLALKTRLVNRLPFCPDHRDKVLGKPCRECEIERLQKQVKIWKKIGNDFQARWLKLLEIHHNSKDNAEVARQVRLMVTDYQLCPTSPL